MSDIFKREDQKPVAVVALAVFLKPTKQFLVFRRSGGGSYAGYWEFPGGKVEPKEELSEALVREIKEELNYDLCLDGLHYIGHRIHTYSSKPIDLHLFLHPVDKEIHYELIEHDGVQWVLIEELEKIKLAPADIPLLADLKKVLNL